MSQTLAVTTNGTGGGAITLSASGVVAIPLPAGNWISALVLLLLITGIAGTVRRSR